MSCQNTVTSKNAYFFIGIFIRIKNYIVILIRINKLYYTRISRTQNL